MLLFKEKIISKAKQLGFDLIGFSKYQTLEKEIQNLEKWLSKNYQAGMNYMEKNLDKKKDVNLILENCKSVISLGMNYFVKDNFSEINNSGKVSRYAWGKDYHLIIWEKLDELIEYAKIENPNFKAKSYVDTGPVMDKVWAVKSGIGWQGKNSNIINREIGSWFFISTFLTNFDFENYENQIEDFCGSCTACIKACPTNAIIEDYVVDSNKCISYLTIENKSEISNEFIGKFDNWIFGCDVCQDVCPWNIKFAESTNQTEFLEIKNKNLSFEEIEKMEDSDFKNKFCESPILRTKLKGLRRNSEFLQKLM
ncbi:MAG: tRNA epoxyqueuosine(34) reductase QueG [Ignavibacteriae bacterium]|nr:tRNA epoxyqueuosine(34) reductase QueG [Ignavibacteriota bacterium]